MLANIEPAHNDFHALASYLIHGRDRPPHPDRVAWVIEQNLGTDDPIRAAKLMQATAELSKRCTNACYHASINWHPDEKPTPEIMQEIARKTLDLAGLGEHQALVMGHGDKAHRHMHLMINRVHPETGRAWSTSHDFRRFDRIMKQLSDDYGFQYVPPHAFEPELTDELPKGPDSNATYAAKTGAPTNRPQWPKAQSRAYGARLSEHLDRASSWDDVDFLLAEDGLTLDAKGNGLVVGNADTYCKLSALGLHITANGLLKKFGPRRGKPPSRRSPPAARVQAWAARTIWTVDAVDIARAIGSKEDVRAALRDVMRERKARLAGKPLMDQLMEELKEVLRTSTILGHAPRAARKAPARPRAGTPHKER